MIRLILVFLIATGLFSSSAIAQSQNVSGYLISFKIKNLGATVNGLFKSGSIKINWNEKSPNLSSLEGSAEANSISTGNKLRDSHLKDKEEFFNASKYGQLKMKSVMIEKKGGTDYEVTWDLTMKGITRRLKSNLKVTQNKNQSQQLTTEFSINRKEWNIGGNSLTMSDMVTIKLQATISK